MFNKLWNDEVGAILSAEIVLIGTILVIGMVVGLVELQCSIADELNDLGEAIGAMNQSYVVSGQASFKRGKFPKGLTSGSRFSDRIDTCDGNECSIVCVLLPRGERPKGGGYGGGGFGGGGRR